VVVVVVDRTSAVPLFDHPSPLPPNSVFCTPDIHARFLLWHHTMQSWSTVTNCHHHHQQHHLHRSQQSHRHLLYRRRTDQTSTKVPFFRRFLLSFLVVSYPVMTRSLSSSTTGMTSSSTSLQQQQEQQPRVAVIGAGAAGLAAARVISRDCGIRPVVFEKEIQAGGIWRYESPFTKTTTTSTSSSTTRKKKDRPMYKGLRTNLPKELMAFREYPFPTSTTTSDDDDEKEEEDSSNIPPSFVTHEEVQRYLLNYETHFDLNQFIQYGSTIHHLKILPNTKSRISPTTTTTTAEESWPQIELEWTTMEDNDGDEQQQQQIEQKKKEIFDVVFVCNGHYAAPSIPYIPGLQEYFHGNLLHSIEYDTPEEYKDQIILCIGGRASGADLARELSYHAKHVYLSDTTCHEAKTEGSVTWVPKTISVDSDGRIVFADDCPISLNNVDTIILCSGYDYQFPFIQKETSNINLSVTIGERRVKPLVYQLWHATYPSLVFVGLPHSVVPFPLFELQCEAVIAQWKKECRLPSTMIERMTMAGIDAESGGPKGRMNTSTRRVQDTHFLGDFQWAYCRQLVELAQFSNKDRDDEEDLDTNTKAFLEDYLKTNEEIYNHAGMARKSDFPGGPDDYRSIRYFRSNDRTNGGGVGEVGGRGWKVLLEKSSQRILVSESSVK